MTRTPAKRGEPRKFLNEVVLPYEGDECLAWPFSHNSAGYPNISDPDDWSTSVIVSRLLCEHQEGPAPDDKPQAAHRCGHEWCVNPKHVRWASPVENAADKFVHGTAKRSELRFVRPDGSVGYRSPEYCGPFLPSGPERKRGPGQPRVSAPTPSLKEVGSVHWADAQIALAEKVGTVAPKVSAEKVVERAPSFLSANQRAALAFIAQYIEQHQFPPSYPEIAKAIGVASAGSVHKIVHRLAAFGAIEIVGHGNRRGIRLSEVRAA